MENKDVTLGVVGNGVLGQAMVRGMVEHVKEVRIFDIDEARRTHTQDEVYDCDWVFLCLPTPPTDEGRCDTSALVKWFDWIIETKRGREHLPFMAIRSTINFGFTTQMATKLKEEGFPPRVVHWPEFLTARCSVIDFHTPSRQICGIPLELPDCRATQLAWAVMMAERFPGCPLLDMTSAESEITKLSMNSFFATKVTFFNGIKLLCDELGLDYQKVRGGMLTDGRVAHSHTQVPGPDRKHGFGGTCLPKDLLNLMHLMSDAGQQSHAKLLGTVADVNERTRHRDREPLRGPDE